jgi:hypothetical protein
MKFATEYSTVRLLAPSMRVSVIFSAAVLVYRMRESQSMLGRPDFAGSIPGDVGKRDHHPGLGRRKKTCEELHVL